MMLRLLPGITGAPKDKYDLVIVSGHLDDYSSAQLAAEKQLIGARFVTTGWLFMEEDYPNSDQEIDRYAISAAKVIREEIARDNPSSVVLVGRQHLILITVASQLFPEYREQLYKVEQIYDVAGGGIEISGRGVKVVM